MLILSANDRINRDCLIDNVGSFGHFQASRSGVHKGSLHLPLVKAGFVATRISVRLIVTAFISLRMGFQF